MRLLSVSLLALAVGVLPACSTTPSVPRPTSIRAAAIDWANAFLFGTVGDIEGMESPTCRAHTGTTLTTSQLQQFLLELRSRMQSTFKRPLTEVAITGVETRDLTSDSGEAEVEYNLPASEAGNDNWVAYTRVKGIWKVSNCYPPIGGESTIPSVSPPPAGSTGASAAAPGG